MKTLALLICFFSMIISIESKAQSDYKLFYDEPAFNWLSALPVGNGRLGAMVYGGVAQEHIQFNEETLWTGEPHDYSHKGAGEHLDEIRQLLFEGKQHEAQDLASEVFMSEPLHQMAYQPFGDLIINFPDHKNYSDYNRTLDLGQALLTTTYKVDGVEYTREVFISKPDDLIAIKLTSKKEGALNFDLKMDSQHFQKSVETYGDRQVLDVKVSGGVLTGKAWFKLNTDGNVTPRYENVTVSKASSAVIYLTAYTSFVNFRDVSGRPQRHLNSSIQRMSTLDYEEVKKKHIEDYQSLYNRFEISFEGQSRNDLTTDERIQKFWRDPNDPAFVSQYVQFARYLMISSSRPGGQPANLQGIWNNKLDPPWQSKWTTNINAEMNYWPAEVTNLSECHEPFFNMIEEVSQSGAIVAKEHYNADGWVLHHNTDIWRGAAPINHSNHGIWPTGGAWISSHLWEHYLFTQDKEFLKEKYSTIKGAALFFSQMLVVDPKTGYLISTPSNSPEIGGLVAGPTMDHQLIRNLFRICVDASDILDTDKEFASKLKVMIPKIAPNQIGRLGQLQEWMEDKDDPEVKHRHVSHLWGMHPGNEINWRDTPDLMKAARQSLEFRGDKGTGWSLGWKINFWARFLDGNRTYKLISMLLSPAEDPVRKIGGGSYPNLFDSHPPFQIDGNFGGAAGIVEMLLQSHLGTVDLLPALPDALPDGRISGVMARGGFELAFSWKDSELERVEVTSKAGQRCQLRYGDRKVDFDTDKGNTYTFNGKLKNIN